MKGAILTGAILAAGEGSRLKAAGFALPKPFVPVAGAPLLEHVVRNLEAAGIEELAAIFNDEEEECAAWLRARVPYLSPRVLVKTTGSSLESFREITALAPDGRLLVSTVDAFCAPGDFVSFVAAASRLPEAATALAVTPLVDDERPLWVTTDGAGRVTALGGDRGEAVTAGIYVFSQRARHLAAQTGTGRLRDFLIGLVTRGEIVHAISIPSVVDVDRAEDVAAAEALALRETASWGKP